MLNFFLGMLLGLIPFVWMFRVYYKFIRVAANEISNLQYQNKNKEVRIQVLTEQTKSMSTKF